MAKRADVFMLLVTLMFILHVKRKAFVSSDIYKLTFNLRDAVVEPESHLFSSLWMNSTRNRSICRKTSSMSYLCVLILLGGDIETLPGPERQNKEINSLLRKRGLKLFHQNVRGLLSNKSMIDEVLQSFGKIDLLSLSETHLSTEPESMMTIPGFTFEKLNRVKGSGGGVGAYISDRLNYIRRTDLETPELELMWVEIIIKSSRNILIGVMYRPPDSSKYLHEKFNEVLQNLLSLVCLERSEILLMGDCNVNYLSRSNNKEFKQILELYSLKQIITKPTRITDSTSTLIDIIACSNPSNISQSDVCPMSIGDHDMIGCVRKINNLRYKSKCVDCRDYRKYSPENFTAELQSHDWSFVDYCTDVNVAWAKMKLTLTTTVNKHAPKIRKRITGKPAPWLTAELKAQMNERDKLLRSSRKSKKPDRINQYKQKRNLVKNLIRKAKADYTKQCLRENSDSPDRFWKILKNIFPSPKQKTNMSKFIEVDGVKTDNGSKIAASFSNFFKNAAITVKRKAIFLTDFCWRKPIIKRTFCRYRFNFGYVSRVEIEKYLRSLKRKKSAGPDDIPPGMLKDASKAIAAPLAKIVNLSLQTSTFPTEWKSANVTPVFKSGNPHRIENYRPICLLPILSKIAEKAVHRQLISYLEQNKLLNARQYGFRANRSTELAAIDFVDNIRSYANDGKLVGAVFVDLSKAFDTVSHSTLLEKMQNYGILENELEWFRNYLFQRDQTVCFNGEKSQREPVFTGVPQGSILGPLLFIMFINDLSDVLEHSHLVKYADDMVLFTAHENFIIIENKLNADLERLSRWFDNNDLVANLKAGKTESMIFGTAKRLYKVTRPLKLEFKGELVNFTKMYKYLGVHLTDVLSTNYQFDENYKRFTNRLRLLRKVRYLLDEKSALTLYDTMFSHIFSYCSILSLNYTKTQLEKLKSLEDRATAIIYQNSADKSVKSIWNVNKLKCCKLVRKCMDKTVCENFHEYFQLIEHESKTRNNQALLRIPKCRLEFGKKAFKCTGARIYNELPEVLRKEWDFNKFADLVKSHFF